MPKTEGTTGGAGIGSLNKAKTTPTNNPVPSDANDWSINWLILENSSFYKMFHVATKKLS
jgi:hypothetical protein